MLRCDGESDMDEHWTSRPSQSLCPRPEDLNLPQQSIKGHRACERPREGPQAWPWGLRDSRLILALGAQAPGPEWVPPGL